MRTILSILLLAGAATVASAQCYGPGCYQVPRYIYQPQITYQPMEYKGTVVTERWRPLWFGYGWRYRGRTYSHQYGPATAQPRYQNPVPSTQQVWR